MKMTKKNNSGFTFAETLAAMLFMAIVVPVMVQGMTVASHAGIAAQRQREAVELADRLLTELVLTDDWRDSDGDGDFGEDWPGYRWVLRDDGWEEDTMREVTVEVLYTVQGRERSVTLTTLADEAEL
jgi:Tfp pilus assembly protein PilV